MTGTGEPDYVVRPIARHSWLVWIALLLPVAGTLPALWWHVEFFGRPGRVYRLGLLVALPAFAALFLAVHRLRSRFPSSLLWPVLPLLVPIAILVFRQPAAVLVVSAYAASLLALGVGAAALLRVPPFSALGHLGICFALGSAVATVLIFLIASFDLLNAATAGLLLLPALLGIGAVWRSLRDVISAWRAYLSSTEASSGAVSIALTGATVLLILAAASAASPAFHGDSIRFHLALAKIYAQQGTIEPPPYLTYGYYPQGFESQLAALYLVAGFPAANLLAPVHFLVFLLLLAATVRACGIGRTAAVLACALCVAVPFLHFTGATAKNDLLLSLYLLAAFYALIEAQRSGSVRLLVAGALLLGAAAGVKHTVAFTGVPLALLLAWAMIRSARRWQVLAAAAVLGSAAGLFWHVRTWSATGDPLYPPALANVSQIAALSADHAVVRFLEIPYSIHFRGRKHFESHSPNSLGVALLVLAPMLLFTRRARVNTAARLAAIFIIASVLFWATMLSVLRYIIPVATLLIAFGAARMEALLRHRTSRIPALASFAYVFVFALPVTVIVEVFAAQPAFLARRLSTEAALERALPAFAVMSRLAEHAGPEDDVLSIGNYAVCYAPYPANVKEVLAMDRPYGEADLAPLRTGLFKYVVVPDTLENTGSLSDWQPRELYRSGGFRLLELTR